ncbi:MAG TPA: hypothetical protein VGK87_00785 [Anaerolineae bacterium]
MSVNLRVDDYLDYFDKYVESLSFNRKIWVDRLIETCKELNPEQASVLVEQFMSNYVDQLR